jgi:spore coat polysaccharide biosynthesis protein SpsF
MRTVAVIQARMGSSRLPGKVTAEIDGRPMLRFMIDRLATCEIEELVLATSDLPIDDPVAEIGTSACIPVVRGSEADVLDRFRRALELHPADVAVRLTADCPLADPDIVNAAVRRHAETNAAYTSNTLVRTFPDGLDVEVIDAQVLREAADRAIDPAEREHVTAYVYRHPTTYALSALRTSPSYGDERWTVDTQEDLEFIRGVVGRVGDPLASWQQILSVIGVARVPLPGGIGLVPASTSEPWHRVWNVLRDGEAQGDLSVDVTGTIRHSLADDLLPQALTQMERLLRADQQVQIAYLGDTVVWRR